MTTYLVVRTEDYSHDQSGGAGSIEASYSTRKAAEKYIDEVMGCDRGQAPYRVMTKKAYAQANA